MKLTANFSLAELTKSHTATKKGIKNEPNDTQLSFLVELCENVLQPLRDAIGPINISSGLRVPELNKAIGGSATSQHCALRGAAADISNPDNKLVFNYIKENIDFDQLIWEFGNDDQPDWVHVSYHKGHNRKQILKAIKKSGKTTYIQFK